MYAKLRKKRNDILVIELKRASKKEINVLKVFLREAGFITKKVPISWKDLYILKLKDAKYHDVFEISFANFEHSNTINNIYAGGLYLGLIYKTSHKVKFKPGLPLARRLSKLCKTEIRCHVVNEKGEKRFLYGRTVPTRMILNIGSKPMSIVINILGEPLGWGRVELRGRTRRLVPLIDLGWYLRRGG